MLKSIQILKQQNIEKRTKTRDDLEIGGQLRYELIKKLEKYLSEYDSIKLEIRDNKLGLFVDLLDEKLLADYEFFQESENVFIFKKRVISI